MTFKNLCELIETMFSNGEITEQQYNLMKAEFPKNKVGRKSKYNNAEERKMASRAYAKKYYLKKKAQNVQIDATHTQGPFVFHPMDVTQTQGEFVLTDENSMAFTQETQASVCGF